CDHALGPPSAPQALARPRPFRSRPLQLRAQRRALAFFVSAVRYRAACLYWRATDRHADAGRGGDAGPPVPFPPRAGAADRANCMDQPAPEPQHHDDRRAARCRRAMTAAAAIAAPVPAMPPRPPRPLPTLRLLQVARANSLAACDEELFDELFVERRLLGQRFFVVS